MGLICMTFLAFEPSINIPLMLLNSWLDDTMNMKCALHGQLHMYDFGILACFAKLERGLTLQMLGR